MLVLVIGSYKKQHDNKCMKAVQFSRGRALTHTHARTRTHTPTGLSLSSFFRIKRSDKVGQKVKYATYSQYL